jgi:hypothetical protein
MKKMLAFLLCIFSITVFASEPRLCKKGIVQEIDLLSINIVYEGHAILTINKKPARELYLALGMDAQPVPSSDAPGSSFPILRKQGKKAICFMTLIEQHKCAQYSCNLIFEDIERGE